jgi:hypothetical protein
VIADVVLSLLFVVLTPVPWWAVVVVLRAGRRDPGGRALREQGQRFLISAVAGTALSLIALDYLAGVIGLPRLPRWAGFPLLAGVLLAIYAQPGWFLFRYYHRSRGRRIIGAPMTTGVNEPALQSPSVGRTVHYVLDEGPSQGQHRPAVIVRVWGEEDARAGTLPVSALGTVQLQVLTDSGRDGGFNDELPQVMWRSSVPHDESGSEGSWHWPERVEPVQA